MKKIVAAIALCAVPVMAFAATASASGDYPPDDSEVGTETEEECDGNTDIQTTDPGDGAPDTGDPDDNTVAGEAGTGGNDDPRCDGDSSAETDQKPAAIAQNVGGQPEAATANGPLPATGNDTSTFVRIGAMSLIAGGALVMVAWWRKRPSAA